MRNKSLKCLACVLIAAAFVVPAGVFGSPPKHTSEKQWTIMIFWCADNNLEWTTEFCMNLWQEALTSNDQVNILVLLDIESVDGTWIYELTNTERIEVAAWPEKNTSDPAVLEEFVLYCMDNYPAQKNMLLISDHGYGWRGICEDETNGDVLMTPDGIGNALRDVKAGNGKGVDLLVFDACNMASLEVAYELRGAVPIMVATETMEPYDGPPYKMFITDMVDMPSISPHDLAVNIVREYVMYYGSKTDYPHQMRYSQDFATIAAIDLDKIEAVGEAFNDLAVVLKPLIPDHMKQVDDARGYALIGTWTNMAGYEWMPDVYTFVEGLRAIEDHPELTSAIDAFELAFDEAIIAEAHSKKYHDSVHGLNFWFPPSLSQYNMMGYMWARQFIYEGSGLDLVDGESPWVQCLMTYYSC